MKCRLTIVVAYKITKFLKSVSMLISKNNRLKLFKICVNGRQFHHSKYFQKAQLVITEIPMPLKFTREIHKKHAKLPILTLSMHKEKVNLYEMTGAGLKAFAGILNVTTDLFPGIEKVVRNELVYPMRRNTTHGFQKDYGFTKNAFP